MKMYSKISVAVTILLLLAIAYAARITWLFSKEEEYIGQLHRTARTMASTLYLEHFHQDPSSIHVLWWTEPDTTIPGLTVHTFYPPSQFKHILDSEAKGVFIRDFNYIATGQAAHLALNGEDSPRIRRILELAQEMYLPSSEGELFNRIDDLKGGDAEAKALFQQVYDWSKGFNRELFDEVLMPSIESWQNKK